MKNIQKQTATINDISSVLRLDPFKYISWFLKSIPNFIELFLSPFKNQKPFNNA